MSGVEAAGFILAAIPLVISAVENYEVTFRPFVTYCRYSRELRDFKTTFATQKQLFRSYCLLLLAKVGAESALENPGWRPGQEELALEKRITECSGENLETLGPLIQLIDRTVSSIQGETRCLNIREHAVGSKAWARLIQQKIRFSVSQPRLKAKVATLRELNGDFLALIEAIERLQSVSCSVSEDVRQSVDDFVFIQNASRQLYDSFSNIWKCSYHTIHSANICLSEVHQNSVSKANFEMVFDFVPGPSQPIWLEIESSAMETGRKRGHDEESSEREKIVIRQGRNTWTQNPKNELPDLCSRRDLCLLLEEGDQRGDCLGVMNRTGRVRHLVYKQPARSTKSVSLHGMISDSEVSLSGAERIQLARSISTAVMQFNSSAWLPETWRSSNVLFYGLEETRAPFLSVQSCSSTELLDPLSPIRNQLLFGLGLILLELGFESPLDALHQAEDLEKGQKHRYSDYLTAKRLKKNAGKPLGARFGRITRKCLDCDFAAGEHDLKSPELQLAFYKEVILELRALEELFEKLERL